MKKILLIAIPVIILASVAAFLYFRNTNDSGENGGDDNMTNENTSIVNESEPETAQEDFTDGDERAPGNSLVEEEGNGYIEDTSNSSNPGSSNDSSKWTVSSDGKITVFLPVSGEKLGNGSVISGQSAYSNVSFRLIDNVSGVISEGKLGVSNGNFSGIFNFSTTASEGRLDLFYQTSDGVEKSNINIPVVFK